MTASHRVRPGIAIGEYIEGRYGLLWKIACG